MLGFLLNLLIVALQSYTIYFLNSKFPETGQKVEQDIKSTTGVGNSLELGDSPAGPEAERFQTKFDQSPEGESHTQPPSENHPEQASPLQNSSRDNTSPFNSQAGYLLTPDMTNASVSS